MPYYLVTQTTLIEASDPESAATAVLAKLVAADEVAFAVKLDNEHVSHVVVSRRVPEYQGLYKDDRESIVGDVLDISGPDGRPNRILLSTGIKLAVLVAASMAIGLASGLMIA